MNSTAANQPKTSSRNWVLFEKNISEMHRDFRRKSQIVCCCHCPRLHFQLRRRFHRLRRRHQQSTVNQNSDDCLLNRRCWLTDDYFGWLKILWNFREWTVDKTITSTAGPYRNRMNFCCDRHKPQDPLIIISEMLGCFCRFSSVLECASIFNADKCYLPCAKASGAILDVCGDVLRIHLPCECIDSSQINRHLNSCVVNAETRTKYQGE